MSTAAANTSASSASFSNTREFRRARGGLPAAPTSTRWGNVVECCWPAPKQCPVPEEEARAALHRTISGTSPGGPGRPRQSQKSRYGAARRRLPIATPADTGKGSSARQSTEEGTHCTHRQDQAFFAPPGHLYQKMQACSPKLFCFHSVTKMHKSVPRAHSLYQSTGVVTEEVLETKISKLIAVKVMTSLSTRADRRCRNPYATNYSSFRLRGKKNSFHESPGTPQQRL